MFPRLAIASLLATIALVGCGREPGLVAPPRGNVPGSQVDLPGNYRPGQPLPGSDESPSLLKATFPKFALVGTAKSDPVNMLVAGSERQLRHIFAVAGWVGSDPVNPMTVAKLLKALATKSSYPTSPISDLFLYDRKQDMAYQKNQVSVYARDHLRVWKTPLTDRQSRPVWAIAATKDVAIRMGIGDKMPTHQISPDIDAERQLVVDDFLASGQVALRYQVRSLPAGYKGKNGPGDEYYTDGLVEVLELVTIRERAR